MNFYPISIGQIPIYNWMTNKPLKTSHGISRHFAWNRFDIGITTEFKVQRTPLNKRPAYSQSLPAPIDLKDDILVELAPLHN